MFRLRVLSLHPAASAIGRVLSQGIPRTQKGFGAEPPCDHFVGALSAVPPLGPFLRSQQAHAVHCMSPSPVNDDPRSRVGMGAALKGMIVPTVRPKPDRSGTQLAAGTGCELYRPCHDDGQHLVDQHWRSCPSSLRQIVGLRYTSCQLLPAPFCLPSSNNI